MDLNEIPSDHIVVKVELEEKKVANFDGNVEKEIGSCRKIKGNEVSEQRFREIEEKQLAIELEIQKKGVDLEGIKGTIRVLEDEKVAIEKDIEGLKKKRAALEGGKADETMGGGEFEFEEDEESRVVQLMIENKVLECEKSSALQEVEVWKQKCKELESRVVELEGRLRGQGVDHTPVKKEEAMKNGGDDVQASREMQNEGTPCIGTPQNQYALIPDLQRVQPKTHVKRQLIFQNERSCDRKIAPSTPAGPRSSAGVLIDITDSDDEGDIPEIQRSSLQSNGTPCLTPGVAINGTVDILDQEGTSGCQEKIPFVGSQKRKRGSKVITSDDEHEAEEATARKRTFKVDDSDSEGEDDGIRPIKQLPNSGSTDNGSDDDDNIPISQLKTNRAQGSSQPACSHKRSYSGIQADNLTDGMIHPRRRLVKCKQGKKRGRAEENEDGSENLASEDVEGDKLEEDSSDSDRPASITRRRRRLFKSREGIERSRAQKSENGPENLAIENLENEKSEEDSSDSDTESLSRFIVNDSDVEDVEDDVQDVEDDLSEEDDTGDSYEPDNASDDNLSFKEIISRFQSRKDPNSKWVLEGDMLSDFGKDPELCMRAVCALYRQQTTEEKSCKDSIIQNRRGFSKFDAPRGTDLGNFLTDGDPNGDLVKTVEELQEHDPNGVEKCCTLANHYSKQLFEMYENEEDPFFP